MRRLAILSRNGNSTNRELVEAAAKSGLDAFVVPPEQTTARLRTGDVVLGRLDVRPTLDGPERGLETLRHLEEQGVRVLNRAGSLLGAHDKLMTALRLARRALPHPRTAHVDSATDVALKLPVVVKPRFGSWGRDVTLCRSRDELERSLRRLSRKAWFRRHGALVQELVEPQGYDLRIIVATGEIVGAVRRIAAPGEWRTNIALGGRRTRAALPARASLLALGAAAALDIDLVGVDLLPDGNDDWVVLELNGAVDFTSEYSLDGEGVFERVVHRLADAARIDIDPPSARVSKLSGDRSRTMPTAASPPTRRASSQWR